MAEAPEAEGVFQVGEFFAELVQVEILFRVAVHDQPGLRYCFAARSSQLLGLVADDDPHLIGVGQQRFSLAEDSVELQLRWNRQIDGFN